MHPPVGVGTLCYQISTSGGLDSLDFTIAIGYLGTEVSVPEVTLTLIWTKVLISTKYRGQMKGVSFALVARVRRL